MTKDIDGNNLSGKSGIRVERTLDGTPITDSEGKTIAELEEERAKLRGIEERSRIRLHSDRYKSWKPTRQAAPSAGSCSKSTRASLPSTPSGRSCATCSATRQARVSAA